MHESFESPAAIDIWALRKGHNVTYSKVYQNDVLPTSTKDIDFLIVMGGPQNPATSKAECKYFDSTAEIDLIKSAINSNCLVLGICLGAQLIGEAYGEKFEHSPYREIGVFPITLTEAGKADPIFSTFPETFLVGHWHGDMPGITESSEILATSEGCPRQVVRYDTGVYGFQCHFEFTPDAIERMIEHCSSDLSEADTTLYIQSQEVLRKNNYEASNQKLFKFLDYMENDVYLLKKANQSQHSY
ncbi:hypothetical protein L3V83_15235 [Thiotrichales bacterium 19X7-9]|nr:hypothetical protein [Thiotrichales bacterium 19X7-9]